MFLVSIFLFSAHMLHSCWKETYLTATKSEMEKPRCV